MLYLHRPLNWKAQFSRLCKPLNFDPPLKTCEFFLINFPAALRLHWDNSHELSQRDLNDVPLLCFTFRIFVFLHNYNKLTIAKCQLCPVAPSHTFCVPCLATLGLHIWHTLSHMEYMQGLQFLGLTSSSPNVHHVQCGKDWKPYLLHCKQNLPYETHEAQQPKEDEMPSCALFLSCFQSKMLLAPLNLASCRLASPYCSQRWCETDCQRDR